MLTTIGRFRSSPSFPIVAFKFPTVAESQDLFYQSTGPIDIRTCYAECLVVLSTSPSPFRPSASVTHTPQPHTRRTPLQLPFPHHTPQQEVVFQQPHDSMSPQFRNPHYLRFPNPRCLRSLTLGARAPRNEWEHFRNISRSGSILLHCNQQTHLWNIWNVLLR